MSRIEFSRKTKTIAYERTKGVCGICRCALAPGKIEYDHILPAALGGDASPANCMAVCQTCHAAKTAKEDVPRIRKADRQKSKHIGAVAPRQKVASRGFPRAGKGDRDEKPKLAPRALYQDADS